MKNGRVPSPSGGEWSVEPKAQCMCSPGVTWPYASRVHLSGTKYRFPWTEVFLITRNDLNEQRVPLWPEIIVYFELLSLFVF